MMVYIDHNISQTSVKQEHYISLIKAQQRIQQYGLLQTKEKFLLSKRNHNPMLNYPIGEKTEDKINYKAWKI